MIDKLNKAISDRALEWGVHLKSASFKGCEMAGEAGEVCNEIKKLERQRLGMVGGKTDLTGLKEEIGDLVISTMIIAQHYDLDIMECAKDKFNKTSEKHGFKTRI